MTRKRKPKYMSELVWSVRCAVDQLAGEEQERFEIVLNLKEEQIVVLAACAEKRACRKRNTTPQAHYAEARVLAAQHIVTLIEREVEARLRQWGIDG
jgi:hypothetical protein